MNHKHWAWALALVACDSAPPIVNQPPVAIVPNDINTSPGVTVSLNGAASKDPDGTIVSYKWTFGDGQAAEGAVVEHAWQTADVFVVQLAVTDDLGAEDVAALRVSTSTTVNLNQMPTAVLQGPARGVPGETLAFDGSGSSDPDGSIAAYRWSFGDGDTADGAMASHAFAADGTYTVTLVVEDDMGALGQSSRSVVIGTTANNQPPIADAGPAVNGAIGVPVTLDGSASTDSDGTVVSYAWDLGDGNTANTRRVTHTYAADGNFTATLTVTDDGGATAMDTTTVTIAPPVSYDGNWILNPTQAVQTCMNTHRTYQVAYPATRLMITGTTGSMVTAVVTGEGRTMTGTVDRNASPPTMALSWMGSETDGTCGTASVQHSLSAMFSSDTTISGRVTVIYNWTDPFCNCARPFDYTGAKQ